MSGRPEGAATLSESGKILARRFSGRPAESGLLVLVLALGVGAASSGFSLLAKAQADLVLRARLLILFLSLAGLLAALVFASRILTSRGQRMRKGLGIMMALGASRRSVFLLLATEAAAVSVAGSLLGGLLSLPISRSMLAALGLSGASWLPVLPGLAASSLLSLAFAVATAWRNTRLEPAEALGAWQGMGGAGPA
jgi:hypothetical protein